MKESFIDMNAETEQTATAGIAENVDLPDGEPIHFSVNVLRDFVDFLDEMGWEHVTIYERDHGFLIAHEYDDDFGVYVVGCPYLPDGG